MGFNLARDIQYVQCNISIYIPKRIKFITRVSPRPLYLPGPRQPCRGCMRGIRGNAAAAQARARQTSKRVWRLAIVEVQKVPISQQNAEAAKERVSLRSSEGAHTLTGRWQGQRQSDSGWMRSSLRPRPTPMDQRPYSRLSLELACRSHSTC